MENRKNKEIRRKIKSALFGFMFHLHRYTEDDDTLIDKTTNEILKIWKDAQPGK